MVSRQMLTILFLIVFSIVFTTNLSAQYFKSGGTGYFATSVTFVNHSSLTGSLIDNGLIPQGSGDNSVATTVGGGGGFIFANRWMISGDGYHAFYPSIKSNVVTVGMEGGGASITASYLVINKNKWLAFPALGIGFTGYRINIDNQSEENQHFGDNPITPGTAEKFISTFPVMDIRIGVGRLISKKRKGFYLGLDVGYTFNISEGNWKNFDSGNNVEGVNGTGYKGFYIKLNIGGGRFRLND